MALGYSIGIFFILVSIAVVLIFYRSLPPFLPIYNKLPWGYARVGTKIEFFIPVGIGALLYLFNVILGSLSYKKSVLIGRFFSGTTILISIAILIFVLQIIFLVR